MLFRSKFPWMTRYPKSMNRFRLSLTLALLAALSSQALAGWLELGDTFVKWEGSRIEYYDLLPSLPGAPQGLERIQGLVPSKVEQLGAQERLFVVEGRHFDPRSEVKEAGRILVDSRGVLLVASTAQGELSFGRMSADHEGEMHVKVQRAPESGVLRRRVDTRAIAEAKDDFLVQACAEVDAVRWSADVDSLVAFGTRNSRTQKVWDAAEWAKTRLTELGYATSVESFSWWGGQAPNVVARLFPGAEGEERPILLVGAHIDSINMGNQNVAPGADDNASGAAGILEVARVLAQLVQEDPGVEIRMALFSGEEQGLYGSKAMVKTMQQNGELSRVVQMINMDMIGFDQGNGLDVTLESKAFNQSGLDRMAVLAATYTDLDVVITTNAWGSDHVPFLSKGVPAILPIEGEYDDNPHDHTGHDLATHLNPDLAKGILQLVVASVLDALPTS